MYQTKSSTVAAMYQTNKIKTEYCFTKTMATVVAMYQNKEQHCSIPKTFTTCSPSSSRNLLTKRTEQPNTTLAVKNNQVPQQHPNGNPEQK